MRPIVGIQGRRARTSVAAVVASAALVASACGGGSKPSSTPPPARVSPFTGLRTTNNPVIAVKVDDTAGARPQVGLDRADIVYIAQVEGGLTRLIAVFNTHLPSRVGPVRSTRNDDPEVVAQYGPIIYVASGGDRVEYRPLDRSDLHPVINDRGGPGFSRDAKRTAPLNLFVDLRTVARKVHGVRARSIGLHWSTHVANTAAAGDVVSTKVGATPVVFRWRQSIHRYVRYFDGHVDKLADGSAVSTPNVIVQFVHGSVFRADIDPAGNPAWYQHTVGTGRVVVFRDGRRIEGRWSRPSAADGTQLTDRHGKPIALSPGGAWFVLADTGTPLAG